MTRQQTCITAFGITTLAAILAAGCNGPPNGSSNAGLACQTNRDCAVGTWCEVGGTCVGTPAPVIDMGKPGGCQSNKDCAADEYCLSVGGTCAKPPATPDLGDGKCKAQADCPVGMFCDVDGVCKTPNLTPDLGTKPDGSALMCGPGQMACNGICANTQTDVANCGACGVACAMGQICGAGKCITLITVTATPAVPAESWIYSEKDPSNTKWGEKSHNSPPPSASIGLTLKQICEHAVPQNGDLNNKVIGLEFQARLWNTDGGAVTDANSWFGFNGNPNQDTIAVTVAGKSVKGVVNFSGPGTNLFVSLAAMQAAGVMVDGKIIACP